MVPGTRRTLLRPPLSDEGRRGPVAAFPQSSCAGRQSATGTGATPVPAWAELSGWMATCKVPVLGSGP